MKVLTQEEFNKAIKKSYENYDDVLEIQNHIIKDIYCIIYDSRGPYNIVFSKCRIERINTDETPIFPPFRPIIFDNCEIVDFEKISNINTCKFRGCEFLKPVPLACPKEGEFIGYKKCIYLDSYGYDYYHCIVKLLIPEDAKRSSAFTNKCRCSKAKVLDFYDIDGYELKDTEAYSIFDSNVNYKVGKEVYPDSFDENRYNECSHGIHFFMSFDEARDYY